MIDAADLILESCPAAEVHGSPRFAAFCATAARSRCSEIDAPEHAHGIPRGESNLPHAPIWVSREFRGDNAVNLVVVSRTGGRGEKVPFESCAWPMRSDRHAIHA